MSRIIFFTPGQYISVRLPDDPPEMEFIQECKSETELRGSLVLRRRLVEIRPPSGIVLYNVGPGKDK